MRYEAFMLLKNKKLLERIDNLIKYKKEHGIFNINKDKNYLYDIIMEVINENNNGKKIYAYQYFKTSIMDNLNL